MFFFLSGYLTKLHYDNYMEFCKKRLVRVAIPFIFWSIVCCIADLKMYSPLRIFLYTITGKACFPYYFILVYIQFVLLAYPISCLALSKYKHMGWFISLIYLIIMRYIPIITGVEYNYIVKSCLWSSVLGWFLFFYFGLLLGNGVIKLTIKRSYIWLFLFISIALQIGEAFLLYEVGETKMCGTQQKLTSYITSIIMCILCYSYAREKKNFDSKNIIGGCLILLGDCSFGIFLIHILVRNLLTYSSNTLLEMRGLLFITTITLSCLVVYLGRRCLPPTINKIIGF